MIKIVRQIDNNINPIFNVQFDELSEQDLTTVNKVYFQGTSCSYENSRIAHEFKL